MGSISLKSHCEDVIPQSIFSSIKIDTKSLDGESSIDWEKSEWKKVEDNFSILSLNSKPVTANIRLNKIQSCGALVVQTNLIGKSEKPFSWNTIQPLRIFWLKQNLQARTLRGGSTETRFPPIAYTPESYQGTFRENPFFSDISISAPGEHQTGRSAHDYTPIMQSGIDEGGLIAAMEWSGLWKQHLKWDENRGVHVQSISIPVNDLELSPEEKLELPPVHIVFYQGDIQDGGNAFRHYMKEKLTPSLDGKPPKPPLGYSHWFGIGSKELNEDIMLEQLARAEELNLDYFEIDAGWFGEPFGENGGDVGNWQNVDEKKFPNGLKFIADKVKQKEMGMGLWFEIERASTDSEVYQKHPEWFITIEENGNHLLNLGKKKPQEWAIETISKWVDRLDLKYLRWDANIDPLPYWQKEDPTGKVMFKYVDGLYRVREELLDRHPDLVIENCSGGGTRNDIGLLSRSHTALLSDHNFNPHMCRYMQSGANRFFPGNYTALAIPVGPFENPYHKRFILQDSDIDPSSHTKLDLISRMLGAFQLMGKITEWSEEKVEKFKEIIEWYDEWRWILLENFYPLTSPSDSLEDPEVLEFVSRRGEAALVYGFVGKGSAELSVPLRGLDKESEYLVNDPFGEKESQTSGKWISEKGLKMEINYNDPYVRTISKVS